VGAAIKEGDMDKRIHSELEAIAEKVVLDGTIDAALENTNTRLAADSEWSRPQYTHVHVILESFVVGVISADPWTLKYALPPDFEGVVNWIAFKIQERWKEDEVVEVSLLELERLFMEWGEQHPSFRKWNEPEDPTQMVGVVSRYSKTPEQRDFIDLHALVRNAAVHLRDKRRHDAAFEKAFANRYPDG